MPASEVVPPAAGVVSGACSGVLPMESAASDLTRGFVSLVPIDTAVPRMTSTRSVVAFDGISRVCVDARARVPVRERGLSA